MCGVLRFCFDFIVAVMCECVSVASCVHSDARNLGRTGFKSVQGDFQLEAGRTVHQTNVSKTVGLTHRDGRANGVPSMLTQS